MVVPASELCSARISPPCSAAISHTSDSPSPTPPYSRLRNGHNNESLTVLTLILLVCSLVACNDAGKDKTNDGDRKKEIATLMATEPKSMEEATKLHQDLMVQETAILSDNNALWEKVFLSANKGSSMIENGSNYGDFLLSTIEGAKDQFKADELKILRYGACPFCLFVG